MNICRSRSRDHHIMPEHQPMSVIPRRSFLRFLGFGATTAVTLAACTKTAATPPVADPDGISFGQGNTSVFNYAYALEQLQASFYTEVIATPYNGITTQEQAFLTDICRHEIIHREFYRTALGAYVIPRLKLDFSSVDFTSRKDVLTTARIIEDLAVSAYNGAARCFTISESGPGFMSLFTKIGSVEARHAALMRELLRQNPLSDNLGIGTDGLDKALTPLSVMTNAGRFIKDKINIGTLPR